MSQVKTYTTAEIRYGTQGGSFVATADHKREVAAWHEQLERLLTMMGTTHGRRQIRDEVRALVAPPVRTVIPAVCTHGAYDDDAACMDCLKAWGRWPFKVPDAEQTALPEPEQLFEAISGALGDALDCTRVWSAWGIGTMSESDFVRVADDQERLHEIASACLAKIREPNNAK